MGHSGNAYHKNSLQKHITNHHKGTGPSIRNLFQQKKTKLNPDDVLQANCTLIAENALPKDFFDQPGSKTWLKTMSEIFDKPDLAAVGTSARSVGRFLATNADSVRDLIREKGGSLAKNGSLSLQADHFSSRKSSSEPGRDFLGIILNCRDQEHKMRKIPLAFEPSINHSYSQFRKDLKRVLSVSFRIRLKDFFGLKCLLKDFVGCKCLLKL